MGNKKQELTRMDDLSFGEKLFIRHGYKKLLKLIEEKYGGRKDLMILDVGCGPGVFADELRKKGILSGLDIDHASLASGGRSDSVCGDAAFMPFKDSLFDAVISRSSFGYWDEKRRSADEILRVLKPGGYFFIYDLKKIDNGLLKSLLILADVLMACSSKKMKDTREYLETMCSADELEDIMGGNQKDSKGRKKGIELNFVDHSLLYTISAGKKLK